MTISATDVGVKVGKRQLLKNVTAQFPSTGLHAIVGPNGAGKSTFLKTLCGLLPLTSGQVQFDQQCLNAYSPLQRAANVAYLPQQNQCHWELSVEQVIQVGLLAAPHLSRDMQAETLTSVIEQFDLDALQTQNFNTLSGGEKARVLLARAMVAKPRCLLADEPLNGLDIKYQSKILQTLREIADQDTAIVVVLHDLNHVLAYAHTASLFDEGELIEQGAASEVLSSQNIDRYFQVKTERIGYADGELIVLQR
ncbi:MAG: iron complex transport system ATP-binding protein [Saprospiraceae bacterium]|jgi:iron complex transport system ATP-binding protein